MGEPGAVMASMPSRGSMRAPSVMGRRGQVAGLPVYDGHATCGKHAVPPTCPATVAAQAHFPEHGGPREVVINISPHAVSATDLGLIVVGVGVAPLNAADRKLQGAWRPGRVGPRGGSSMMEPSCGVVCRSCLPCDTPLPHTPVCFDAAMTRGAEDVVTEEEIVMEGLERMHAKGRRVKSPPKVRGGGGSGSVLGWTCLCCADTDTFQGYVACGTVPPRASACP